MKRILFASAAAMALALALAPAMAQTPDPTPATPPITEPEQTPTDDPTLAVEPMDEREADVDAPAAAPTAPAPTPAPRAEAPSTAAPASAAAVCQPRTTTVHFGARGATLSRENRNAIEYAVDAASVCDLQQVTIADSGEGGVSSRRAQAVRQTLIRQGVPSERIAVDENADVAGAETGQLEVRMSFAGVADSGTPTAQAPDPTPDL